MISVILPVFNASFTVARAIESILAQTFGDFELIAVDDGSTDGSGDILDNFAQQDTRVKVFHKSNGGANSARNLGLEHVRGEYVTFCDADDYVDSNWLQAFADNLDDNDVVIQGWKYVREDVVPIFYENTPSDPAHAADVMSGMESFGFLWNKCFRTDIIRREHLRFDERFRFLEDEEFVCHYWTFVKTLKFVRNAAYNYIVPDFNQKYTAIDNYELYVLLVNHASQFIYHADSVTMHKYTMGLFRCMQLSFAKKNRNEGWLRLNALAQYGTQIRQHNKYMRWIRPWNCALWYSVLVCRSICDYSKS